jgi:Ca2+:H+ antiporter
MEMLGVVLSILISYAIFADKKVNWLEGAMLIICYVGLAAAFLMFGV